MKKGIIFDLDGTLWDTTDLTVKGWNRVFEKYPQCKPMTNELMESYMGKTLEEIAQQHMPNLAENIRQNIAVECANSGHQMLLEKCGEIYPDVEKTLNTLKGKYHFYCVSNSEDGYVQIFMKVSKLGYLFDDYEMAGRTGKTKGENIRLVAERNNLDMCCYVGDTVMDKEASLFASVPFVFADYGFGSAESEYVLQKFSDLPQIAEKIFNTDI